MALRAQRSDARRNIETILAEAARLLATRPAASMQEVAAAAGVHRATVHRHFPAREDLVHAVHGKAFNGASRIVSDERLTTMDPGASLREVTRAILEHGDRYRTYLYPRALDEAVVAEQASLAIGVMPLISRAQEQGVVRADLPADRLAGAWGGLVTVYLPEIAGGRATVDEVTELVLVLLAAPTGR